MHKVAASTETPHPHLDSTAVLVGPRLVQLSLRGIFAGGVTEEGGTFSLGKCLRGYQKAFVTLGKALVHQECANVEDLLGLSHLKAPKVKFEDATPNVGRGVTPVLNEHSTCELAPLLSYYSPRCSFILRFLIPIFPGGCFSQPFLPFITTKRFSE